MLERAVPQIVLLLVAGLLADAMNRRKLMMCTQIDLFCVSTTLALLTLAGKASPQMLYIATMLLALFTALEQPSRQSIIPHLVPHESLAQALALQGTQRHVPNIAGPSLAGLVLALFGPAACYMVDAISWLAMLSSLALARLNGLPVNLPRASTAPKQAPAELTLTIDKDQQVYVNKEPVPVQDVGTKLLEKAGGPNVDLNAASVIINADTEVKHGLVVKCIDEARAVGITKFGIATAPEGAK